MTWEITKCLFYSNASYIAVPRWRPEVKDVTVFKDATENLKTRLSLTMEGTNVTEILFFLISLDTN